MNIKQAGALFPEGEGEIALSYLLDRPLSWVRREGMRELPRNREEEIIRLAKDRQTGRPLQYVLGKWDFYGRTFRVDERALIPRPETELLVEAVLREIRPGDRILDLGTGTGIIPLTLALEAKALGIPLGLVLGTDISRDALDLAGENRALLYPEEGPVEWAQGDLFEAVGRREPFDWIISNPPYVDPDLRGQLQRELDYEPGLALYAPDHGRAIYREIVSQAGQYLKDGGRLALEIGDEQGEWIRTCLQDQGFNEIEIRKDYSQRDRMAFATWQVRRNHV